MTRRSRECGVGPGAPRALFAEVFWAALHAVATLTRAGRLPPEETGPRVELLVDRLAVVDMPWRRA
ncbi:hypothetical protein [Micromonospora endolithica]|uniref:hypothetical protein n=1 Tax=Micromonospora endolithica TaxID=230091 RepID=UPI0011AC1CA1|nr:hypothetical protein [Micromonospora endolithica]TWJ21568.1 hypothetical protein JD76_01678 [Micromonospora endolithica]